MHDASRRDFVRTSAATAAFVAFGAGCAATAKSSGGSAPAPAPALPPAKPLAPGTLRLGMIGFGVRARELHGGFLDDDRAAIVAVADVADARAAEGVRLVNARRGEGACKVAANWRRRLLIICLFAPSLIWPAGQSRICSRILEPLTPLNIGGFPGFFSFSYRR